MTETIRENHAQFAKSDDLFKRACKLAEIPATRRQASKWRNGGGKAFAFRKEAATQMHEEFNEAQRQKEEARRMVAEAAASAAVNEALAAAN